MSTYIANDPRTWRFGVNSRHDVSLNELINILDEYGFQVRAKSAPAQRDKPFEELSAERFEGIDRRIRDVSGAWKDAHGALEFTMLKQREGWAKRFEELEKKIEQLRKNDEKHAEWHEVTEFGPRIEALERHPERLGSSEKHLDQRIYALEKSVATQAMLGGLSERIQRIEDRVSVVESYTEVASTTVHLTKDEANKIEERFRALEKFDEDTNKRFSGCGKQCDVDEAFTRLTEFENRLDILARADAAAKETADQLSNHFDGLNKDLTDVMVKLADVRSIVRPAGFPHRPGTLPDALGRITQLEKRASVEDMNRDQARVAAENKAWVKAWDTTVKVPSDPEHKEEETSSSVPFSYDAPHFPPPSERDFRRPEFDALWSIVKQWDIAYPDAYDGRTVGAGNHVMALLRALERAGLQVVCKDQWESEHTGIEVIVHDFPGYATPLSPSLHDFAANLRRSNPTRVVVDMSGIGSSVATTLKRYGLNVVPMPKPKKRSDDARDV